MLGKVKVEEEVEWQVYCSRDSLNCSAQVKLMTRVLRTGISFVSLIHFALCRCSALYFVGGTCFCTLTTMVMNRQTRRYQRHIGERDRGNALTTRDKVVWICFT